MRGARRETGTASAASAGFTRLRRTKPKRVVQAAESIAARDRRDLLVAERAQLAIDGRCHIAARSACANLVGPDLDARDGLVMPHAADPETEIAQHALGTLDHPQLGLGDLAEVRDPRRQAGGRRLVPASAAPPRWTARESRVFVRSASSSGLMTPNSRAAWRPGR